MRRGARSPAESGGDALSWTDDLVLDLDAAQEVTETAGIVEAWGDQSAENNDATGAVTERPTYNASSGPGGNPAIVTSSISDRLTLASGPAVSGPWSVYWVGNLTSTTAEGRLFDVGVGSSRRILAVGRGAANRLAWFDGSSWRECASVAPSTGEQAITFVLQDSGGEGFLDRVSAGTNTYPETDLSAAAAAVFSRNTSTPASGIDGRTSRILVYSVAHDAAQRAVVWNYLNSIYGVA